MFIHRTCLEINSIIFDLDGTLVDSAPGIEYAASEAWAAVRPGPPCPHFRRLIGPALREMFRRALPDASTATLVALERAFRSVYDRDGWEKTSVYPGVTETLAILTANRMHCFGATNKRSLPTQRILEHCGLQPYFQAFLSPESRTPPFASKSEAILQLLMEYSLDPARTLLMGDSVDDARAAQSCGLRFVAFAGGYGQVHQQAEVPVAFVCVEFPDLLKLFHGDAV